MIGRIADAFQLAWGFIYWNMRKTRFRMAGGRVPCPCQSPSDSGRAMETRCEPSLLLHRPSRFRHVCPLLKQTPGGHWRCSVDTLQVRPFWFRAFGTFFTAVLLSYLAATVGIWGFLRWRGYALNYAGVAWPPAWSRFHVAQSRFFVEQGNRALAKNDIEDALMSFSVAYQTDRGNYALGRTLAQLAQIGKPGLAERVYEQLSADHPNRRPETFAAWYEALLTRGDFKAIVVLAREALAVDRVHTSAWLNALVFALRREPDPSSVKELARAQNSPEARAVFELELQTAPGGPAARAALLQTPSASAPAYLAYYRVKHLIELGFAHDALTLLSSQGREFLPRDQVTLRFEAYTALGWFTLLRGEIDGLLSSQLNPATAELLAAYLIRHPDAELFRHCFDIYKQQPISKDEAAIRAWAAWLCAAGANGDFIRLREAAGKLKETSGIEYRSLRLVESFFRGDSSTMRIEAYLPTMQLISQEITYALLERYYRPHAVAPSKP